MVPIESSLREEFFYNLPRSGKLDFAKFSGGKLRAHPGFTDDENGVANYSLVGAVYCAVRSQLLRDAITGLIIIHRPPGHRCVRT